MLFMMMFAFMDPEPIEQTKYSLADYNKSGQAVCTIKPGSYETVGKKLKNYGFRILQKSKGNSIAIAWDKRLTAKDLIRLLSIKDLESLEPDAVNVEKIFKAPIPIDD